MGLFDRRKENTQHDYEPLALPGWHQARLMDATTNEADFVLGSQLASRVVDSSEADYNRALDECDSIVREVIYVLANVAEAPTEPSDIAYDFATGWLLAQLEVSEGLAKPGQASKAALMALAALRVSLPEGKSYMGAKALESGYFARRTEVDASELCALLVAGRNM